MGLSVEAIFIPPPIFLCFILKKVVRFLSNSNSYLSSCRRTSTDLIFSSIEKIKGGERMEPNLEQIVEDWKHEIIELLEESGYKVKKEEKWTELI